MQEGCRPPRCNRWIHEGFTAAFLIASHKFERGGGLSSPINQHSC